MEEQDVRHGPKMVMGKCYKAKQSFKISLGTILLFLFQMHLLALFKQVFYVEHPMSLCESLIVFDELIHHHVVVVEA